MIFVGDIHGELSTILGISDQVENENLIQVGDFGVGFTSEYENMKIPAGKNFLLLNEELGKRNNHLYVIRGNHDNPQYFKGDHTWSNIQFVPDYTVLELEGEKILCLGGAISVDRCGRTLYKSYWSDEGCSFKKSQIENLTGITMVATHTTPDVVPPFGFNPFVENWFIQEKQTLSYFDPKKYQLRWNLEEELIWERGKMTEFLEILRLKNELKFWIFGHFHSKIAYEVGEIKFLGLDVCENVKIK